MYYLIDVHIPSNSIIKIKRLKMKKLENPAGSWTLEEMKSPAPYSTQPSCLLLSSQKVIRATTLW